MLAYIVKSKVDTTPKVVCRSGQITNAIKRFLCRNGITKARIVQSERPGDGQGEIIEL